MTVTLPLRTQLPPQWRILRKRTWAQGIWDILPTNKLHGAFFVEEFWRSCIPEPGQATFRYDMGLIDGLNYGLDSSGTNESETIDLLGQIIRIQAAPGFDDLANQSISRTPEWKTVWVGVVELQKDTLAPGSSTFIGSRKYHCLDLLASFTKRQPINRHSAYINGNEYLNCYGHPGYNGMDWDGRVLGNKETSGTLWYSYSGTLPWDSDNLTDPAKTLFRSKLLMFNHAGTSTAANAIWTDLQAVENMLATSRIANTPFFYMYVTAAMTSILSNSNAWPVHEGMTAWDFLVDIFKRQRARGLAFLDWDDDTSAPEDDLTVYIRLNPQTVDDISYTPPGGVSTTITGATNAATTKTVDLVGDHRNMSSTFDIGDRYQHVYNYIESLGERIEVLATIDYPSGTLASRWIASEETNFVAKSIPARRLGRYDTVWQLHGLSSSWDLTACDGNGSSGTRCDYRCKDDGTIDVGSGSQRDTSPILVNVLHDLPLYAGYNYAAAEPARYDAQTETLAPSRRLPMLLIKHSSNRYLRGEQLPTCAQVHVTSYGIEIFRSGDPERGQRCFSLPNSTANLAGMRNKTDIVLTVGLQMPHHVRMASGDVNGLRKKQIFHKGLHLWVAHPLAIWELDEATISAGDLGAAAKRDASPTSGSPGILRDDRAKLAREHAMAASWYLTARRTATWQLKACGILPSFLDTDGAAITYPTLGKVVTTMTAGTETYTLNTPITKVHYTNRANGVTTWITDWSDLDLR